MDTELEIAQPRRGRIFLLVTSALALVIFAILIMLGTWQVQRMHWKEGLLATIDNRVHSAPVPLEEIERRFAETGDIEYTPVTVSGTFIHSGERHFFATHEGQSGFFVYTPLRLADQRVVLVNRGFVPYDLKDAAKRPTGQVEGEVTVTGLARNPLSEKPSFLVPENDTVKNVFYWKDRDVMAATAGLEPDVRIVPVFVDADTTPNPGGLPVGGVTLIDLPNNHMQYVITWYGLALALFGVFAVWAWRAVKGRP